MPDGFPSFLAFESSKPEGPGPRGPFRKIRRHRRLAAACASSPAMGALASPVRASAGPIYRKRQRDLQRQCRFGIGREVT